jgi:hypothetical protein
MTSNNKTQEAVLKTVIFFDLFNYPLTNWEIWQYLKLEISLGVLESAITDLVLVGSLEQYDGFIFTWKIRDN